MRGQFAREILPFPVFFTASWTLLGDRLFGDRLFGDRLLGDRLLGDRLFGDRLLGDRLFGDRLLGDRLFCRQASSSPSFWQWTVFLSSCRKV